MTIRELRAMSADAHDNTRFNSTLHHMELEAVRLVWSGSSATQAAVSVFRSSSHDNIVRNAIRNFDNPRFSVED